MLLNSSGNEANYRTSAYEAITSYLTQATPDTITVVQSTAVTVLQRMEQLLSMQVRIQPFLMITVHEFRYL